MDTDKMMKALEEATRDLPPVEEKGLLVTDTMDTCVCGKQVNLDPDTLTVIDTGLFKTLNNVCRGCKAGSDIDRTHARLVCARCKRVLAHPEPMKDPKSGFAFEAGRSYHTDGCALCKPSADGSQAAYPVIEALVHMRNKK